MDDNEIKNKLLEYDTLLYNFQIAGKDNADEEWIKLFLLVSEFTFKEYQEVEKVFPDMEFHFETVMHATYPCIARGLIKNPDLLKSEKVKTFLVDQVGNKKWLSGRASFLRPLVEMQDKKLIYKIAREMPDLWEVPFANTFLMEAVSKMRLPGFRKEMGQFLNSGAKNLVRRAENYLKNESKYKEPV